MLFLTLFFVFFFMENFAQDLVNSYPVEINAYGWIAWDAKDGKLYYYAFDKETWCDNDLCFVYDTTAILYQAIPHGLVVIDRQNFINYIILYKFEQ